MSGHGRSGERFHSLVLQMRARMGITQRELAARMAVHVHTVQAWEAGVSHPSAASLQALISVGLAAGGFTLGHEMEEAAASWSAALRDAPRLRVPFDQAWFTGMLDARADTRAIGTPPSVSAPTMRRQHWGDAPDVVGFLGRATERQMVRR